VHHLVKLGWVRFCVFPLLLSAQAACFFETSHTSNWVMWKLKPQQPGARLYKQQLLLVKLMLSLSPLLICAWDLSGRVLHTLASKPGLHSPAWWSYPGLARCLGFDHPYRVRGPYLPGPGRQEPAVCHGRGQQAVAACVSRHQGFKSPGVWIPHWMMISVLTVLHDNHTMSTCSDSPAVLVCAITQLCHILLRLSPQLFPHKGCCVSSCLPMQNGTAEWIVCSTR
jgi:hypothetical protein